MTITTEGANRLYQQVADAIAKLIRGGQFAMGSRLPPERDLVTRFGVSRPTVREALVALEIAGLVEVRVGSGAYVCPQKPAASNQAVEAGPSAFEVIKARRLLEPAVAAEAALARTSAELMQLAKAMELCERQRKGTHWEMLEADRVFHLCIARATHNARIVRVVESFWQDMFSPIFAILSGRTRLADKKMLTLHDHRTIFSCIERHDAAGAQAAMLSHLVHAEMKLLKAESDGTVQSAAPGARRMSHQPKRPRSLPKETSKTSRKTSRGHGTRL
jgi:DNA-binding FadR family transcriptional regulator